MIGACNSLTFFVYIHGERNGDQKVQLFEQHPSFPSNDDLGDFCLLNRSLNDFDHFHSPNMKELN
jgi:hypothetical protein